MPIAWKCRSCGHEQVKKWSGFCPGCCLPYDVRQINSDLPGAQIAEPIDGDVIPFSDAVTQVIELPRIETNIAGVDYVLGGGFAKNGLYLLCGSPGSGKTTVLLQVCQALSKLRHDVLYVTGEQTVNDLALRAKAFGKFNSRMSAVRETDLDAILDILDERKPALAVIDSIQTIFVSDDLESGSSMSIKVAVREFMKFAKEQGIAIVLIGHITKGGAIGGPQALNHYVDCSLFLEGRKESSKRILRCDQKNRFAGKDGTPVKSKFDMTEVGLVEAVEEEESEEESPEPTSPPELKSVPLDIPPTLDG